MGSEQRQGFSERLARIDEIHAQGGAFEARGALGRSYFDAVRPRPRRQVPWRAIGLLFFGVLVIKAAIYARIGAASYATQVDALQQGNVIEQGLAWVAHADPLTQIMGGLLHALLYR